MPGRDDICPRVFSLGRLLAIGLCVCLAAAAACSRAPAGGALRGGARAGDSLEAAYRAPPTLTSTALAADGRVILEGRARAGTTVRLASPAGDARLAPAGPGGDWRAVLPASAGVRLLGMSMREGGRALQAEGYLAITPGAGAAQLRAGAGALVLSPPMYTARILAIDYDRQGGAVVSGRGSPGDTVLVTVDGAERGRTAVDRAGRFSLAVNQPLAQGLRQIAVVGKDGAWRGALEVADAPPMEALAFRAERAPLGWRIDWRTPAGGIQTTVLVDGAGPSG